MVEMESISNDGNVDLVRRSRKGSLGTCRFFRERPTSEVVHYGPFFDIDTKSCPLPLISSGF